MIFYYYMVAIFFITNGRVFSQNNFRNSNISDKNSNILPTDNKYRTSDDNFTKAQGEKFQAQILRKPTSLCVGSNCRGAVQPGTRVCTEGGKTYKVGERFKRSPCVWCECTATDVVCIAVMCAGRFGVNCTNGIWVRAKGGCCEVCSLPKEKTNLARGGSCVVNGKTFSEGERVPMETLANCDTCRCIKSKVRCASIDCPQWRGMQCKGGIWVQVDGVCCAECRRKLGYKELSEKGGCVDNGKNYLHGEMVPRGKCAACTCLGREVNCINIECPEWLGVKCTGGNWVPVKGKCCKECRHILKKKGKSGGGVCLENEKTYRDGESVPRKICEVCTCYGGEVNCAIMDCPDIYRVECRGKWIRVEGKCCMHCADIIEYGPSQTLPLQPIKPHKRSKSLMPGPPPKESAVQVGTRVCTEGGKTYKLGERFKRSACVWCECTATDVVCMAVMCAGRVGVNCKNGIWVRPIGECCEICSLPKQYGPSQTLPLQPIKPHKRSKSLMPGPPPKESAVQAGTRVCTEGGITYKVGERFKRDACVWCECTATDVVCIAVMCAGKFGVNCKNGIWVRAKGGCCEICSLPKQKTSLARGGSCVVNGKTFSEGERVPMGTSANCDTCTCTRSKVRCISMHCPQWRGMQCKGGLWVQVEGVCCAECRRKPEYQKLADISGCVDKGKKYLHGEMVPRGKCEACTCLGRKVSCINIECPQWLGVKCTGGEWVPVVGKCCKECQHISRKRGKLGGGVCVENGKTYRDGESVPRKICEVCTCYGGEVNCAIMDCPDIYSVECRGKWIRVEGKCCMHCADIVEYGRSKSLKAGPRPKGYGPSQPFETTEYGPSRPFETTEYGPSQPLDMSTPTARRRSKSRPGLPPKEHRRSKSRPAPKEFRRPQPLPDPTPTEYGYSQPLSTESGKDACIENSKIYKSGHQFPKNPCTMCKCEKTKITCHTLECPKTTGVNCKNGLWVHHKWRCCGICIPPPIKKHRVSRGVCIENGRIYRDKQPVPRGVCDRCSCLRSKITCAIIECPRMFGAKCEGGQWVDVEGLCCPECRRKRGLIENGDCVENGKKYMNGEMVERGNCEACTCSGRKVNCANIECPQWLGVKCTGGSWMPVTGKCCNECQNIPKTRSKSGGKSCVVKGKTYRDGESVRKGVCDSCVCQGGTVNCVYMDCPDIFGVECKGKWVSVQGKCCLHCADIAEYRLNRTKAYTGQRTKDVRYTSLTVNKCPKNTFGPNCDKRCNCDGEDPCNKQTGVCPNMCHPRYYGRVCNKTCPIGRFLSRNVCYGICRCFNPTMCQVEDGVCRSGGCSYGWSGATCQNRVCPVGFFKVRGRCTGECHCRFVQTCNAENGECSKGSCAQGWTGSSCQKRECEVGYFGHECKQQCHCANEAKCNIDTGHCPQECILRYFGDSCDKTCPKNMYLVGQSCSGECHCRNNQFCHVKNGKCLVGSGGCVDSFSGHNCQTEIRTSCPDGYYDPKSGCSKKCQCPNDDACDDITGACRQVTDGCINGGQGPDCVVMPTSCPDGYYDPKNGCNKKCQCTNDDACDALTGACAADGCNDGSQGADCVDCKPGFWGKGCTKTCHCSRNEVCDPSTGLCPNGCHPRYTGGTCQDTCLPGVYKSLNGACDKDCHCEREEKCEVETGKCLDKNCAPGWKGIFDCNTRCPAYSFGKNCKGECFCQDGDCDPVTGYCNDDKECEDGYTGETCSDKQIYDTLVKTGPTLTAVLSYALGATILVITILLLFVLYLYYRNAWGYFRYREKSEKYMKTTSSESFSTFAELAKADSRDKGRKSSIYNMSQNHGKSSHHSAANLKSNKQRQNGREVAQGRVHRADVTDIPPHRDDGPAELTMSDLIRKVAGKEEQQIVGLRSTGVTETTILSQVKSRPNDFHYA